MTWDSLQVSLRATSCHFLIYSFSQMMKVRFNGIVKGGVFMWLLYAIGASFTAGITAILVKIGASSTNSYLLTALRTIVVTIFSWIMVFIVGSQNTIGEVSTRTLIFLCASGITTGISWICYFHAFQIGNVNVVVPIDKSSVVLTIFLGVLFLYHYWSF